MIRRPPRSTLDRSSAASDVYKRQVPGRVEKGADAELEAVDEQLDGVVELGVGDDADDLAPVSYTHLRAHETVLDLVCRLLLEKKKHKTSNKCITLETRTDHTSTQVCIT